jgi:preprotein translocase subunit SecF
MFELIKPGTNIDFLKYRWVAAGLSAAVVLAGLASIATRGMNYGIDFAGGTLVHVRFQNETPIAEVRETLGPVVQADASVQNVGGRDDEFIIRLPQSDTAVGEGLPKQVIGEFEKRFGAGTVDVLRVETVGPRVGRELTRRALLAVLASTVLMGIYVAFRFDWAFGVGAGAALFHDVLIALGALSIAGYEFDLNVVAALLTIVGFSVNDTVVISDRVRENLAKHRNPSLPRILNLSLNETLGRTVLTTGTALLSVLALYLFGGETLESFAFTLLVGFVAGVYSTVFIVAPIVATLDRGERGTQQAPSAQSARS